MSLLDPAFNAAGYIFAALAFGIFAALAIGPAILDTPANKRLRDEEEL